MPCEGSPDVVNGWAQGRPVTADWSLLCLAQCAEKKPEAGGPETDSCPELHAEALDALTRASTAGPEGGGVHPEQPFIVLGQEEYGEHHSSIMHCRWVQAQPSGGGGLPAVRGTVPEGPWSPCKSQKRARPLPSGSCSDPSRPHQHFCFF